MPRNARFWRNVVLIALAHVGLIAALIRWSLAAKDSSEPENIMWLGEAGEVAAAEPENESSPAATPGTTPLLKPEVTKDDEAEEQKPAATTTESEIELPSPSPKLTPRATSTPKPSATPRPKAKRSPRSIPKPTPRQRLLSKAAAKPAAKKKPAAAKTNEKSEKNEKIAQAKKERQGAAVSSAPTSSAGKAGNTGGGGSVSEFAWYGNMLHDRFYRAWIQPTANLTPGTKISTLVKVRIDKDGRVSKFEIIKPSGNVVVNESVRVVAKQVTHVDPPPTGLIKGDYYDVKINFELNTEEQTPD